MTVDLKDIPEEGARYSYRLEAGLSILKEEGETLLALDSELGVDIRIDRAGRRYMLAGRLGCGLKARCDRCLEWFHRGIDSSFRTFLALPGEYEPESEIELSEEDLEVEFRHGDEIDLWEIVREQILLEQPMKWLCSEGCRGLCPKCGVNLNHASCRCREESGHPAFQKLQALKIKGET
jgi:uncharacterized protein